MPEVDRAVRQAVSATETEALAARLEMRLMGNNCLDAIRAEEGYTVPGSVADESGKLVSLLTG